MQRLVASCLYILFILAVPHKAIAQVCSLSGSWFDPVNQLQISVVSETIRTFTGVLFSTNNPARFSYTFTADRTDATTGIITFDVGEGERNVPFELLNCNSMKVAVWNFELISATACGNGIVEVGEDCDNGIIPDNDCTLLCKLPKCGDGSLHSTEECDDGNLIDGDGCTSTCMIQICSNGITEPGEECDDGNFDNTDGCYGCKLSVCGNSILEPGEECDDGNTDPQDNCSPVCERECLGNLTGTWEDNDLLYHLNLIDDGTTRIFGIVYITQYPTNYMLINGVFSKRRPFRRYIDLDNQLSWSFDRCDMWDFIDGRRMFRTSRKVCGNGIPESGEDCDDGNFDNTDGCTILCKAPECGDSFLAVLEECDDGNLLDNDGCDSNCTITACGNGIRTRGEQCDDGNVIDGDCCSSLCQIENIGSPCDDNDVCTTVSSCKDGVCVGGPNGSPGDAILLECSDGDICNGMETCDPLLGCMPGSALICDDGDYCNGIETCDPALGCVAGSPPPVVCGDGHICGSEECDDGNRKNGDGCSRNCTIE